MGRRRTRSLTGIEQKHFLIWKIKVTQKKAAALTLQRAWCAFNTVDPVSLQRIATPFLLYRHPRILRFDADSLANYIHASGDFCDPIARVKYQRHELMRLDRMCPHKENIVDAQDRLLRQREESLSFQSILTALENELRDSILEAIELSEFPDAASRFKREIMPVIVQCFDNLSSIDEAEAYRRINAVYHTVLTDVTLMQANVELRETILALLFTLRML